MCSITGVCLSFAIHIYVNTTSCSQHPANNRSSSSPVYVYLVAHSMAMYCGKALQAGERRHSNVDCPLNSHTIPYSHRSTFHTLPEASAPTAGQHQPHPQKRHITKLPAHMMLTPCSSQARDDHAMMHTSTAATTPRHPQVAASARGASALPPAAPVTPALCPKQAGCAAVCTPSSRTKASLLRPPAVLLGTAPSAPCPGTCPPGPPPHTTPAGTPPRLPPPPPPPCHLPPPPSACAAAAPPAGQCRASPWLSQARS
jgi:hypothetical protein